MTEQPTPKAVEAVAAAILSEAENSKQFEDAAWVEGFDADMATAALTLIRDAINRDGDDADAIRQALGLRWMEATHLDGWRRRVVGEWQEVGA